MSVDNKAPEIRFKVFCGEWEEIVLANACLHFRSGKFIKAEDIKKVGAYPVYGGNGLRGYTSEYNHEGTYALIGRQGALCGNMNFSNGKAFFTEHAIAVQATEKNDTLFLYYKLGLMNLGQYSGQSAQPGLSVNKLTELEIFSPVKAEQTTIGNYFQKLDSLINQHHQKHDKLNSIKKAMLEKMFPKEGETIPEIRFKGFNGEWDYLVLGENAKFTKGQGYSKGDLVTSGSPIILYGRLYTKYQTVINSVDTFVIERNKSVKSIGGEVIVPASGESPEDISRASVISDPDIIIGGDLNIVSPSKKIHPIFLALVISNGHLKKELSSKAQGKSVVHIRNSDLADLELILPTEYVEQTAISNYFEKLDALINQHQQQITKLNNIKQACLSKMFV